MGFFTFGNKKPAEQPEVEQQELNENTTETVVDSTSEIKEEQEVDSYTASEQEQEPAAEQELVEPEPEKNHEHEPVQDPDPKQDTVSGHEQETSSPEDRESQPVADANQQFADQVRADIQVFAIGLQSQLDSLIAVVQRQNDMIRILQSQLEEKDSLLNQQEETIRMQSMRLEKFNDDILYKTQKPLIEELISIADFVRLVLSNDEVIGSKDFDALLNYFIRLKEWVAASLSNNSVKEYCLAEENPRAFDSKKQEITETETTDDPDLDNTYKTERPGYVWTMPYLIVNNEARLRRVLEETKAPKMYEFIIRCEEVIKVKYRKPAEPKQEDKEE